MRAFGFVDVKTMITRTVLLVVLLASSLVQAHLVLVDPVPRSPHPDLTEDPCGGIPAAGSVALYTAGTDIEITIDLLAQHTQSLHAVISYDDFATRTELAMIPTAGPGIYTMSVPLPVQPLGSAALQVVHGDYVSCADITLSDDEFFAINAGLNDAWFNLGTAGQGFFFTVYPEIGLFFLSWFTFDTERPDESAIAILGEPGHRWLTALGTWAGNTVTLTVELTSGGVFDSAQPPIGPQVEYGTITIVFHDCNNATLTYDIPSLGLMGSIELTRVAPDNIALCEALSTP